MKLKVNNLVKITKGTHKNIIEPIQKVFKDYVYIKNVLGLSSKKKSYYIKINKSKIVLVES